MKNLCTIALSLQLGADLDFHEAKKKALEAINKGLKLSFELELGLFSRLKKPLANPSQYLSFELSLKHFKDCFWEPFQKEIKEVILYSGPLDFSKDVDFDHEDANLFFCQGVKMDYLQMLRSILPESMPVCLKLDAKTIQDPWDFALLTIPELYHPFYLILENAWRKENRSSPFAICIPDEKIQMGDLKLFFDFFEEKQLSCRLIPESNLITSWDGLDYLFVDPTTLEREGKRKLQGFVAADGRVVSMHGDIGVANELSFKQFKDKLC